MQHTEGWLTSVDGLSLYYQRWLPQSPIKAIVAMVHGLGSHSGWFMSLVKPLVAHGYAVYALDLRGHGKSAGKRGHIDNWTDFRSDFHLFWSLIGAKHAELPRFALGHSLGGVIVLDYALRHPAAVPGVITMAPAIGSVNVSPLKLAIGQVLSWYWPNFTLDTGLQEKAGSHDPAIVAAYETDPLRHTKGSARLATEFLRTRAWVQNHLLELESPILILHGSDDPVTLPETGRLAFERLSGLDKEYREYPGAYHDLHNDLCAQRVTQDILQWLERHLDADERYCPLQTQRESSAIIQTIH